MRQDQCNTSTRHKHSQPTLVLLSLVFHVTFNLPASSSRQNQAGLSVVAAPTESKHRQPPHETIFTTATLYHHRDSSIVIPERKRKKKYKQSLTLASLTRGLREDLLHAPCFTHSTPKLQAALYLGSASFRLLLPAPPAACDMNDWIPH